MENPCDESFIRGAAAAFVESVAATIVGIASSGAVFMSRFPGKRGLATRRRSFAAARRCNFNGGVRILNRNRYRRARCCERRAFTGLRNGEEMPVICPTCQMFSKHPCRPPATLHGVVFDI